MSGSIKAIIGPMFSGKTRLLIAEANAAKALGFRVCAFRPTVDTREDQPYLISRDGYRFPATRIEHAGAILEYEDVFDVFIIEEAQMLRGILEVPLILRRRGKRVVFAALTFYWNGLPWKPIPELVCHSDDIVIARDAICAECGKTAKYSARIVASTDDILPGGSDAYAPLCASCFRSKG